MSRYIRDFRLKEPPEQSFAAINQFLTTAGFTYQYFEGENVFKKGDGWVTAPTCIKVSYGPEAVRLEGWLKYAVLPGVYGGDIGRDDVIGFAVKGTLKSCFDWCQHLLGGDAYALCLGFDGDSKMLPPIELISANGQVMGGQPRLPGGGQYGAPVQAMPVPQQQYMPPAQQMPAQPAAMVYCVHCGRQIACGSRFCAFCGQAQQ